MSTVYLSLGSNLGDRQKNIHAATEQIRSLGTITAISKYYETEPQEVANQPWFINSVIELETTLSPHELLTRLLEIEQKLGRVRSKRFGARIIDIDILLYDEMIINEPDLIIPHPRLHERAFVLIPLLEIVADQPHPLLQRSFTELLQSLPPQIVKIAG